MDEDLVYPSFGLGEHFPEDAAESIRRLLEDRTNPLVRVLLGPNHLLYGETKSEG